ncbi:hypothetical protein L1987_76962 [Smallanthus sonchifolius]|uniref:Uncharacterized protein n=1 Tax=Smallanthus sonchifolius TaxID=185202 RepID=A0ACB8Z7Q2_9ASTR|nr:hypothetical protein L1987_76962 [Smallanthus sonchifolius]
MSSPAQTNHLLLHLCPLNLFNFPSNYKSESVISRRLQLPAHHTDCRRRCHFLHSTVLILQIVLFVLGHTSFIFTPNPLGILIKISFLMGPMMISGHAYLNFMGNEFGHPKALGTIQKTREGENVGDMHSRLEMEPIYCNHITPSEIFNHLSSGEKLWLRIEDPP